ncbi:MAG TPA: ATP-dependent 6-phosphofructokinase [Pseudonocardia sp.]|jgi:6-phosphofructokinase 1|uniref:ATP-dependent 6-phosphofructokinase n=1 Tax=Pseudonocardia sp. TaxID=60912 RepID=UPI002B8C7488|nr:ATP-dependent 6-phosphofructokinase [Pseudonocardia sp.]HTF47643.1 ATP-dependent 6-phosphofructokinase [Pseudonocardia sp.]
MTPPVPDLSIATLGPARIDSPLSGMLDAWRTTEHYVSEHDRVLLDDTLSMAVARGCSVADLPSLEPCGPRRKLFFDPSKTRAGIVTCGGLCPGLNDVIRGLVRSLTHHYGVRRVTGFRNGYQGFIPSYGHGIVELTPEYVDNISGEGGTVLGTSRGHQDPQEIVDCLERLNINVLFVVGGDGSMRGAMQIAEVAAERELRISVVGIPKTIDNDIPYIDQSFGFQTAFSRAAESIRAVNVEAKSTPHGVGLVKLMGRHSGFIASYAALANHDADVVLIPEVPFGLDGDDGLLEYVLRRVRERDHVVLVVAEGAGQELLAPTVANGKAGPAATDASGNTTLRDIGPYLRERIVARLVADGITPSVRYIDPSYAIRSVPANAYDKAYCLRLSNHAVHAAMSGRTAMVVGRLRRRFVHIPMSLAVSRRNQVDPHGDLWMSVLEATGQPMRFGRVPEVAEPGAPRTRRKRVTAAG